MTVPQTNVVNKGATKSTWTFYQDDVETHGTGRAERP